MNNYNQKISQKTIKTSNNTGLTGSNTGSPVLIHVDQAERTGREEARSDSVTDLIGGYETPWEGWNSKQVKNAISLEYANFVSSLASWTTFITLTFEDEKTPDVANSLFKWWLRENNKFVFGDRYTRICGHSYFSYAVGMEYQTRDVVHFHLLIDKPINYSLTHHLWGERCGFAWIDGNLRNRQSVVDYVCKYVLKGGQVELYKAKHSYSPKVVPTWWKDNPIALSRVAQGGFCPGQLAQPLTGFPDLNCLVETALVKK